MSRRWPDEEEGQSRQREKEKAGGVETARGIEYRKLCFGQLSEIKTSSLWGKCQEVWLEGSCHKGLQGSTRSDVVS